MAQLNGSTGYTHNNEIAAVHLMNSYCVPSLFNCICMLVKFGHWKTVPLIHVNVALNNDFRQIFKCCWQENPKLQLFYCKPCLFCLQLISAAFSSIQNIEAPQQHWNK